MRFVGIVLLIGLVAGCSPKQPVPVRIGYVETDVPSSSQCVEITGAFHRRPYQLRMAYSQNGKVSYKILNETPCFMHFYLIHWKKYVLHYLPSALLSSGNSVADA